MQGTLKSFQIQAEFVEPLSDLGFDHRHGMSGIDHRHHESMSLEESLDLGVIRRLAGTRHIADHGKDRTLDHGTEEYVRTQRERSASARSRIASADTDSAERRSSKSFPFR